jgi:hypothetical protein
VERHGSVFLGVILLGLGGIFLLRALDVWADDVSMWPGVLIVIGLAIGIDEFVKDGRISWFAPVVLVGLGTFFLLRDAEVVDSEFLVPGLLIVAGLFVIVGATRNRSVKTETINISRSGASRARVRIDHGGGELRTGSLPSGSALICSGIAGGVEQRVNRSGDLVDVSLRQTPGGWAKSLRKEFRLDLSPDIDLELDLRTGASDSKLNLGDLLVSTLQIKTGASSTEVWAPRRGQTRATVEAGAAGVTFLIPDGVAARISADTGLAEVKVDTRRFPQGGGVYESLDFSTAIDRVELRIKGGVASFTVS